MSFSNQDTRDTRLSVTVYKYWGINDTIQEIEAEHNRINGTPTTLEINLYYPAWFPLDHSEPFKTVMIEYGKKDKAVESGRGYVSASIHST